MKNLIYILFTCLFIMSCGKKTEVYDYVSSETRGASQPLDNQGEKTNTTIGFDINLIPISSIDVGDFPYLLAPESYEYSSDEHNKPYEEKYFFNDDSLVMTIGGKYYHTRIIPKRDVQFSETYVVKSYEQAIEKLGGVEVYSGRIIDEASSLLKKNNMAYSKEMYDPFSCRYKQFVIRKPNGNIWFELCSGINIEGVDFTVIFEEEIKESIKL